MRKKVIITVHSDIGAGLRGGELGINAIMNLSAKNGLSCELENRDCPICFADGYSSVYAINIEKVLHVCETVCAEVYNSLSSGNVPILISGDHSSATGTIAGIKKAKPDARLGVIWIDAHADLHSPFTSCSGNMHGMPLAASLGMDNESCLFREPDKKTLQFWECLKLIGGMKQKVRPSDIIYVTLRDLEPQELNLIQKHGIRNVTTDELRGKSANDLGASILKYLMDCTDIYLSFDTDSLDGAVVKGTGLPVENGLLPREAEELIAFILKDPKLICFEITELNPRFDVDHATTDIVYHIFEKAVSTLKEPRVSYTLDF